MGQATAGESRRDSAGLFSSARSFFLPLGPRVEPDGLAGYPIDFRVKAKDPAFPPPWLPAHGRWLYVDLIQWGLGCLERYLAGEGDRWLHGAQATGELLLSDQDPDGAWMHRFAYPHSLPLPPPWPSAMAQGEGASLLVRLYRHTGEDRFAAAAARALAPLARDRHEGGVRAWLDGQPVYEEYPTEPPSLVLNGAIFALWGLRDVGVGLADARARADFETGAAALAATLARWDLGWWSRYDLFPHPVVNPASSFYHQLHITQLQAMSALHGDPAFPRLAERFAGYAQSPVCRRRAFVQKVVYRLIVPRNRLLAHRLPWTRRLRA